MTAPYLDTHTAIVGASGAGKTVTAKDHVEMLLDAGRHVCVLDPTGAWWGMRSSAAGDGEGFPIPIFGGSHGDVPVMADQGGAVGKIVADGVSAIIDISQLRTGAEQRRFVRDLARALRAKPDGNFHFVIDEADEFAPQKPRDDFGFEASEELIWMAKRGRLPGFVLTLITQRPASIDKEALSQAQTIVVHQLVAPVDQKPIVDYLKEHADKATLAKIKASLPGLERGERWVYSPRLRILERGVSPMPRTFDSSRTPEPGESVQEPKMLAQIDLGAIAKALAPEPSMSISATAEAVEKIDTAEMSRLRERIAEIEQQLGASRGETARLASAIERFNDRYHDEVIPARSAALNLEFDIVNELFGAMSLAGLRPIGRPNGPGDMTIVDLLTNDEKSPAAPAANEGGGHEVAKRPKPTAGEGRSNRDAGRPSISGELAPRHRKVLDAIAWCETLLRKAAVERNIVAWIANTSPRSSGYDKTLSSLRTAGMIDYPRTGLVALTNAGRAEATGPAAPPSRRDLIEAIKRKLEPRHARLLDATLAAPNLPISREELAERADYSAASSGYDKSLSHLRTLGLIDYPAPGQITLGSLLR